MSLSEFVAAYRGEVLHDAARAARDLRPQPAVVDAERDENLPAFLDAVIAGLQRRERLAKEPVPPPQRSAPLRRPRRWEQYDLDEVVHEYGALCLALLRVAERHGHAITNEEHQLLNQALDENIAADVVACEKKRREQAKVRSAQRLGFVAHELRNALHSAALSFQAIRSGRVPIEGATADVVERSHHRLCELVEQLLTQVRLGSGAIVRHERLQMAALAEECVAFVAEDAREKGIRVSLGIDAACAAAGDAMLLSSALTNLLQNAVKFTHAGGNVMFRGLLLDERRIRVEIEDECGGIDPAVRGSLFAPFVQGQDHSGLGLGLSIARDIVAVHEGTLQVRDLPGRGCVFCIDLPAPGAPSA